MRRTKRKGRVSVAIVLLAAALGAASYAWFTRPVHEEKAFEPGVVLCRYNTFSESTEQRELGFLQTLEAEYPEINVLSSTQYLGTTKDTSVRRARQLIENYGSAIQGVFCVCEPNSDGMLQVLEEEKLAGTIPFVGCDANPAMIAALKAGKMDGIVLQDPVKMGSTAVETLLAYIQGEEVEPRISTGEAVATAENADSEEMRPMLYPDRFSGAPFKPEEEKYVIGMVPKGLTHEFWQSVRAGAEQAARNSGDTRIRFEAPTLEQDVAGQIEIVRQMIEAGVNGICLSPIDSQKLVPVVIEAKAKGVPVVIFDSNLSDGALYEDKPAKVSYVATNNYEVGALAARRLAELLGQD